jgi:hypothetical protein
MEVGLCPALCAFRHLPSRWKFSRECCRADWKSNGISAVVQCLLKN